MNSENLISILKVKQRYKQSKPYIEKIQQNNKNVIQLSIKSIKQILTQKGYNLMMKLFAMRFLKQGFQTANKQYISLVQKQLLQIIKGVCEDYKVQNRYNKYTDKKIQSDDQIKKFKSEIISYFIMNLQCVKNWSIWISTCSRNPDNGFSKIFQQLKKAGIVFPNQNKYFKQDNFKDFKQKYANNNATVKQIPQSNIKNNNTANSNLNIPNQKKKKQTISVSKQHQQNIKNILSQLSKLENKQQNYQELQKIISKLQQKFDKQIDLYINQSEQFDQNYITHCVDQFDTLRKKYENKNKRTPTGMNISTKQIQQKRRIQEQKQRKQMELKKQKQKQERLKQQRLKQQRLREENLRQEKAKWEKLRQQKLKQERLKVEQQRKLILKKQAQRRQKEQRQKKQRQQQQMKNKNNKKQVQKKTIKQLSQSQQILNQFPQKVQFLRTENQSDQQLSTFNNIPKVPYLNTQQLSNINKSNQIKNPKLLVTSQNIQIENKRLQILQQQVKRLNEDRQKLLRKVNNLKNNQQLQQLNRLTKQLMAEKRQRFKLVEYLTNLQNQLKGNNKVLNGDKQIKIQGKMTFNPHDIESKEKKKTEKSQKIEKKQLKFEMDDKIIKRIQQSFFQDQDYYHSANRGLLQIFGKQNLNHFKLSLIQRSDILFKNDHLQIIPYIAFQQVSATCLLNLNLKFITKSRHSSSNFNVKYKNIPQIDLWTKSVKYLSATQFSQDLVLKIQDVPLNFVHSKISHSQGSTKFVLPILFINFLRVGQVSKQKFKMVFKVQQEYVIKSKVLKLNADIISNPSDFERSFQICHRMTDKSGIQIINMAFFFPNKQKVFLVSIQLLVNQRVVFRVLQIEGGNKKEYAKELLDNLIFLFTI